MWKKFSGILLRNKLAFTIGLLLVTVFMAWETSRIELSYEFAQVLPKDDSTYMAYMKFKQQFGEDGSVMVIGFQDKDLFRLRKFRDWDQLSRDIKNIQGIKDVMSTSTIYRVEKNDSLNQFDFRPLISKPLQTQQEADSIGHEVMNMPFYEGIIYNKETGANLMAITFIQIAQQQNRSYRRRAGKGFLLKKTCVMAIQGCITRTVKQKRQLYKVVVSVYLVAFAGAVY